MRSLRWGLLFLDKSQKFLFLQARSRHEGGASPLPSKPGRPSAGITTTTDIPKPVLECKTDLERAAECGADMVVVDREDHATVGRSRCHDLRNARRSGAHPHGHEHSIRREVALLVRVSV